MTMAVDKYAKFTKPWRWSSQPRPLSLWVKAPEEYGFYEIGYCERGTFVPKYGGRAAGTTLRRRLRKHHFSSHNPHIQAARGRLPVARMETWPGNALPSAAMSPAKYVGSAP